MMDDHKLKPHTLDADPGDLTLDEIRVIFKLAKSEIADAHQIARGEIKEAHQTSGIALVAMLMLLVAFVVVCD